MIAVADVLTHVLVGYVLGMVLAFRYDWMGPAHVTIVMVGALAPDFVKAEIFLPDGLMQHLLGIPFSWAPLHTLGGTILLGLLTALLLAPEYRRQAFALFLLGAASHHVLDVALITPSGQAYAVFWPLLDYRPPAGGLYLSSDRWPALVAGLASVAVWAAHRYRDARG
ncbi:metal-dependent hydrolase [Natronococcus sp. A-GB1]|uniref:metal-dependent hydrolase n=1 Tax=Natronococcus sp. A-GB1 TaxID=3037648 RepID=UPI00241EFB91|nr:metal-dependent hydrolase [Natronococcus sp. A-GB1]MDG5759738.1 metal-dependent hydrolase [Natronococcus sp. A-GB1]